jgi:hypothetical protein
VNVFKLNNKNYNNNNNNDNSCGGRGGSDDDINNTSSLPYRLPAVLTQEYVSNVANTYTCCRRKKWTLMDIQQQTAGCVNSCLAFVIDLS